MVGVYFSLAFITCLLLFSAFFSGSETALTGASPARLLILAKGGSRRAQSVRVLLERKERLIGSLLFGNNLVNVFASALATSLTIQWFGDAGVFYATVVMTLLILIFSEALPKTWAIHNAERAALSLVPWVRGAVLLLAPLSVAIETMVRGALFLLRASVRTSKPSPQRTEEELRGAIELHAASAEDHKKEREMLSSILDLAEVPVEDVMTHRKDVQAIGVHRPFHEIVHIVLSSTHARLPLWRDKPENIVGVLHARALLRALREHNKEDVDLEKIAVPPKFVPETTDLFSQLQNFREHRYHFAVVVDEYGDFRGIVTLQDILEEIVGHIPDRHKTTQDITQHEDGSWIVVGKVTVRDLNRRLQWDLPDDAAATVAGLVLHEARRIPRVGQMFIFYGVCFEILSRQRHQITSLRIRRIKENS